MTETQSAKRIAIIGAGIAGLSAAWRLGETHQVTLFEAGDQPGGHASTADVLVNGQPVSVDTGFIVYNELNYPNFTPMLAELGVETAASDMSFSASIDDGGFEYGSTGLAALFAQKRNLLRPRMWRMLSDLTRLYRGAERYSREIEDVSLDTFLTRAGFSDTFREDHILPMCAAIWSSPVSSMREYPARTFFDFFMNHRLLQFRGRPDWRTIRGGSRNYVDRLVAQIRGEIRTGTPVTRVRRLANGVSVALADGTERAFDEVVFACHSDQALALLDTPTAAETCLLGAVRYKPNRVYLHTDPAFMPRRRAAWSSWNYMQRRGEGHDEISLTYWMNALQPLPTQTPVLVTLNPDRSPAAEHILGEYEYDHPVFDRGAVSAQQALHTIQGENRTWYCGAWLGAGFHEDGLQSGLAVAEALGAPVRPWGLDGACARIHWPDHLSTLRDRGQSAANDRDVA